MAELIGVKLVVKGNILSFLIKKVCIKSIIFLGARNSINQFCVFLSCTYNHNTSMNVFLQRTREYQGKTLESLDRQHTERINTKSFYHDLEVTDFLGRALNLKNGTAGEKRMDFFAEPSEIVVGSIHSSLVVTINGRLFARAVSKKIIPNFVLIGFGSMER